MPRKSYNQAIGAYAGAVVLCAVILVWAMKLWKAELPIPFEYAGDALFGSALIKGTIENGWYLHNDFLGVPTGSDLRDFPSSHSFHILVMKLLSLWTPDYAMVLNLYFLLTFPLAVMASLFVFRSFRLSYASSVVGSLLFAFLPFHFLRGESHIFLASYYLIPLMVMVIMWVGLGELQFSDAKDHCGGRWGLVRSKAVASIAICLLVASGGVYYAFFAGFFLLVAGVYSFLHRRDFRQLLACAILLVTLGLGLLVNLWPSISYIYLHGKNSIATARSATEAEGYGLKLVQLILPVTGHRVSWLAEFKEQYNRLAPLVNENDFASLGTVGSVGFLMLLGLAIFRKPEIGHRDVLHALAVLNIAALSLGTVGGLGSLFALTVHPQIRAYNRISVYIAFFSLFAVVLLLEELVRRWAGSKSGRCMVYGVLGLILLGGIMDQTTSRFVPPYEELKTKYANDADFVRAIEASVPEHAMIFQLPYIPFPEYPPVHQMPDYSLLRGYLHSKTLRWSYGAIKGREGDAWQEHVVSKPLIELVETLAFAGFSGVYIDRTGYADQGTKLEEELRNILAVKPVVIVSRDGNLAFYNLEAFTKGLRENDTFEEWQSKRDAGLHPLLFRWAKGFSTLEGTPEHNWRWCSYRGELHIDNLLKRPRVVVLEMSFETGHTEISRLRIDSPWFSRELEINATARPYSKKFTIPPGRHTIRFVSDARQVDAPGDFRTLVFRIQNFRLKELE